jgi:hypothetical protein
MEMSACHLSHGDGKLQQDYLNKYPCWKWLVAKIEQKQ